MANTDNIDLNAASQQLHAGMDAYRESTGALPDEQNIRVMEDIVIQAQLDASKGK